MAKSGTEYLLDTLQSGNSMLASTANLVDNARRVEGQAIYNEARGTILERQNKLIESIKGDTSLSVEDWEDEYEARKDSISEGYTELKNKYAALEVQNMLGSLQENARSSFAQDKVAYMRSSAIVKSSQTIERAIKNQSPMEFIAGLENSKNVLDPQDYANLEESSKNSYAYNGALKTADAMLKAGAEQAAKTGAPVTEGNNYFASARKAVETGDFSTLLPNGSRMDLPDDLRANVIKYIDQQYAQFTKESDDRNALAAQDALSQAWQNGTVNIDKMTAYMDGINNTNFYDANTKHFWWAQGKAVLDQAVSGENMKRNEVWEMNAVKVAARIASAEFPDKKAYNEMINTMLWSGALDPSKAKTYFDWFDTPDYTLTNGLQPWIDSTSVKDKNGKPILSKETQNVVLATVGQARKEKPDLTSDALYKMASDLGNVEIQKSFGAKIAGKFSPNSDPKKTDAIESALSLLEQNVFQQMESKGTFDIYKKATGLNPELTVQNIKDSVGNGYVKTVQSDMERIAKMYGGEKPLGTTYQWDSVQNAPVYTVKHRGTNGKEFSENFTIRTMTQEYLDEHRDIINAQTKANKQAFPVVGEEYLSLLKNTSPNTFMEIGGKMVEMKKSPRWEETYFSLLGNTGRD